MNIELTNSQVQTALIAFERERRWVLNFGLNNKIAQNIITNLSELINIFQKKVDIIEAECSIAKINKEFDEIDVNDLKKKLNN